MSTIPELLTEKLRPRKFDHLILPDRIRKLLNNGDINQNFLFYGPQGTGKTSTAKVLAVQACGHDRYYINCSDETGVDTIREKITAMCSTISVMDGEYRVKVIILDEIEGVSDQFFKALRGTMEKFTNCRFIATTNYINKIPDPIKSRFELVDFGFLGTDEEDEVKKMWSGHLSMVLNKLGIGFDNSALDEIIYRNFPDMRSALNRIQGWHTRGVSNLTSDDIKKLSWNFEDVYKLMMVEPDPYKNYQFVISNYATKVDDVMQALGSNFIEWIQCNHPEKEKNVPHILVAVADYQAKRHLVIDPVVALLGLFFTVQKTLNN